MLKRTSIRNFACCELALLQHSPLTLNTNKNNNGGGDITRPDTIFEIKSTPTKFGPGALNEIGRDLASLFHSKRVAIITDKNCRQLEYFERDLIGPIRAAGIDPVIFDECRCEPTDVSFVQCGKFLHEAKCDAMVSFGGGSVIDTAKAGSLLSSHSEEMNFDLLQFINAPVGKGRPPTKKLIPHVAAPTTCGTGSEGTPIAICDIVSMKLKTGLSFPQLVPSLAFCDPRLCHSLPGPVLAASAHDILLHAAESLTARPYHKRMQLFPEDPRARVVRPSSQGSNPHADFGCFEALRRLGRSYRNTYHFLMKSSSSSSSSAASQEEKAMKESLFYDMAFASMCASVGLNNSGVHNCHALSYGLSCKMKPKSYKELAGYPWREEKPVLPHGISVAIGAPSTFRRIAEIKDRELNERMLRIAQLLNPSKDPVRDFPSVDEQEGVLCGEALATELIDIMKLMDFPNGCSGCGFTQEDVPVLADACWKQQRLLNNAPWKVTKEDCEALYTNAMSYW